jgi:hypothetical protein
LLIKQKKSPPWKGGEFFLFFVRATRIRKLLKKNVFIYFSYHIR